MNNMTERSGMQTTQIIRASLQKRYATERRFQWYGRIAVLIGFVFLFILLSDVFIKGTPAFRQQYINVPINFIRNCWVLVQKPLPMKSLTPTTLRS